MTAQCWRRYDFDPVPLRWCTTALRRLTPCSLMSYVK